MRFLALRIAWSVGCGAACVLLVALWVQSYSSVYQVDVPPDFVSGLGHIYIGGTISGSGTTLTTSDLFWDSVHRIDGLRTLKSNGSGIVIPDGWLVLVVGALAALPWLRWRFSLRTLLIATTLVAVALGLTVWMSRGE